LETFIIACLHDREPRTVTEVLTPQPRVVRNEGDKLFTTEKPQAYVSNSEKRSRCLERGVFNVSVR
jgi:hypothetical protein